MSEPGQPHVAVAIVGAGASGLTMAMALRRAGRDSFVVLERAGEIGGTWRDNTYPGCACDIPSVLYCLREAPNPGWTQAFAGQPEIQAYLHRVAHAHGLPAHLRLGEELREARWEPDRGRWEITTSAGRLTADSLVVATGSLAEPAVPRLPGLDDFTGAVFHSSRWDHAVALEGRRVAVVGSGASALQLVPEIQPRVGRLTVLQRTPPWVLPRQNPRIPVALRARLTERSRVLALARAAVFGGLELTHAGFRHPWAMRLGEAVARHHLAAQVADPELRARLTPDYRLGCKRILFSNRWYPALTAANTEVVSAGVAEVRADGLLDTDGGWHPLDVIVLATGFRVTDPPIAARIHGPGGRSLADAWAGSPRAHLGVGVAGFPNLFLLWGPNSNLAHSSVLLMVEAQVAYLTRLLAERDRVGAAAVAPRAGAQADSVAEVDRALAGSVWSEGGCASYYVDAEGRNASLWPGTVREYERRLARLEPAEWEFTGGRPALASVS